MIFKEFAGVDAFPIALNTKDAGEIVRTVCNLAPAFGGINLEDISAPRCFEVEAGLRKALDIPVIHDDQHGTAVVVLAALINVGRLLKKDIRKLKVVIAGAGAAGFTAVGAPVVRQLPGDAVSAVLLLADCHMSAHTFPAQQLLLLDILTTSAHDSQKALDVFTRRLSAREVRCERRSRG